MFYSYFPGFSLELDLSGAHATARMYGSLMGDYIVDRGTISTNNDSNIISMTVDVNGLTSDGTELASEMLAANPLSDAPYECRPGREVLVHMETGYGRAPVVLVPTDAAG